MLCPACHEKDLKVIETRDSETDSTRRRRECIACGHRFTTYERLEKLTVGVMKRNQKTEMYDRRKVKHGILLACKKRPITLAQITKIINEIEQDIRYKRTAEIESTFIGEKILQKLKELDDVAYIRFASVFKKFNTANEFVSEVSKK